MKGQTRGKEEWTNQRGDRSVEFCNLDRFITSTHCTLTEQRVHDAHSHLASFTAAANLTTATEIHREHGGSELDTRAK